MCSTQHFIGSQSVSPHWAPLQCAYQKIESGSAHALPRPDGKCIASSYRDATVAELRRRGVHSRAVRCSRWPRVRQSLSMQEAGGSSGAIAFALIYFTFFLDNVLLTVLGQFAAVPGLFTQRVFYMYVCVCKVVRGPGPTVMGPLSVWGGTWPRNVDAIINSCFQTKLSGNNTSISLPHCRSQAFSCT